MLHACSAFIGLFGRFTEYVSLQKPLSFNLDEEEEEVKSKDESKGKSSDIFSRINAFKEKMKAMEDKQKGELHRFR